MRRRFTYIPKENREKNINKAPMYAKSMIKSEVDRYSNPDIMTDYEKILSGGCYYLPNFLCKTNDRTVYNKLKEELTLHPDFEMVKWSKHNKFENPTILQTFNEIVDKMAKHFNVEVLETRLNYYANNLAFKPFHHDSHAYSNNKKENFTIGASFGSTRALEFLHESSKNKFQFTQNNGDVFAFDDEINKKFMHGVPKSHKRADGRFSIIVWGRKI
jgi:hypothetical protein